MLKLQQESTIVGSRFRGLPELAHGGYVAGVMARALGVSEAEVRLRRPVRPDRPLEIAHTGDDAVELRDGETLLARAGRTELSLDVPPAVAFAEAEAASERFLGRHTHVFPHCFVCGTQRATGDGLRIFPGPVDGRALVAAPWVPPGDGFAPDELVWAAFDCTQLWALIAQAPAGSSDRVVTAQLAARIERPMEAAEPHVLIGWPIGRDDRGWVAGAALFGPDGELRAAGRQTAVVTSWGVPLDPSLWQGSNHNPRRNHQ